jgi:hypothetical protein
MITANRSGMSTAPASRGPPISVVVAATARATTIVSLIVTAPHVSSRRTARVTSRALSESATTPASAPYHSVCSSGGVTKSTPPTNVVTVSIP